MAVVKLNTKRSKAGFTLIELLVVLSILAVVAGIVVPNFGIGDRSTDLRMEAQDVAYHLQLSVDEARWHERNIALVVKKGQLNFFDQAGGSWNQSKTLNIESSAVFGVSQRQLDSAKDAINAPSNGQWLIFSNGEYVPFTLTLTLDGLKAEITGDGFNAIAIKP